jgi:hypothetical protein
LPDPLRANPTPRAYWHKRELEFESRFLRHIA